MLNALTKHVDRFDSMLRVKISNFVDKPLKHLNYLPKILNKDFKQIELIGPTWTKPIWAIRKNGSGQLAQF